MAELDSSCIEALRDYSSDLSRTVASGQGLWFADMGEDAEAACAFLAGEALRREVPVLLYPGDELIGRLRRLAMDDPGRTGGVEEEIYEKLAGVDLLLINDLDAAAAPLRYPEKPAPSGDSDGSEIDKGKQVPYEPGMTDTDLSRLFQVVDERLMDERATVITTQGNIPALEESLLRVAGDWPSRTCSDDSQERGWSEAQRRASNLQRLVSRLVALCGPPLTPRPRDINVYRGTSDRNRMIAG